MTTKETTFGDLSPGEFFFSEGNPESIEEGVYMVAELPSEDCSGYPDQKEVGVNLNSGQIVFFDWDEKVRTLDPDSDVVKGFRYDIHSMFE